MCVNVLGPGFDGHTVDVNETDTYPKDPGIFFGIFKVSILCLLGEFCCIRTFLAFFYVFKSKNMTFTYFWVAAHVFSNTGLHRFKSDQGEICSSIVPQVNTHRVTELDVWLDVTRSRWRPWRPAAPRCCICRSVRRQPLTRRGHVTTGARKYDHVMPLLKDLHWLRVPERITYKLCVLVHNSTVFTVRRRATYKTLSSLSL